MAHRKRATRATAPLPSAGSTVNIAVPKPRNAVLQAAALGQVKLGTAKHQKSQGALRRSETMALQKVASENDR